MRELKKMKGVNHKLKEKGFGRQFKEQFRESMVYLWQSRSYVIAVGLIFFSGILLGFGFSRNLGFLDELIKELVGKIEGLSTFEIVLFILGNNLKSALYGLIFGVAFGIFPLFGAFSNGVILGYVMERVFSESGILEFWRILPHGIFELPAIFIALALGLKLEMFVFSRHKLRELLYRARNSMIIFVCIVIPLLIIAAVIEGLLIAVYR